MHSKSFTFLAVYFVSAINKIKSHARPGVIDGLIDLRPCQQYDLTSVTESPSKHWSPLRTFRPEGVN